MKKIQIRMGLTVLILALLLVPARAATLLVPVGRTIGLRLSTRGVTVAEFPPGTGRRTHWGPLPGRRI